MNLAKVKVSKGDAKLAHGLVKSRADQLFEPRFRERKMAEYRKIDSVKMLLDFVAANYERRIVHAEIGRTTGSRARAEIFVAEALDDGAYTLGVFSWRGNLPPSQRLFMDVLGCYVSGHAIARMLQRTVGCGDIDAAVAKIFLPLAAWTAMYGQKPPEADRFTLRGFGGELRCVFHDGLVEVKTWIDTASLPEWKQHDADQRSLVVEYFNGEKKVAQKA